MKGINLKLLTASAAAATTKTYTIPSYADFPNSALHGLPLLIYRPFEHADDDGLDPDEVERLLRKNGLQPAWRYGMFPYDHYHSNVHEILVVYRGSAELCFGHSSSPDCIRHAARPGDVCVIPAGVAHRALSSASDFNMVGSYPTGAKQWDNCRGGKDKDDEHTRSLWQSVRTYGEAANRLKLDPVYGDDGESPLAKSNWTV